MLENLQLVTLDAAEYSYRRGFHLGPVDISLSPGVTALVGPNGAGKTTLIRLLTAVALPQRGALLHGDHVVRRGSAVDALRRRLGYLPQSPRWDGGWRVGDYLAYAGLAFGVARESIERQTSGALEAVGMADAEHRTLRSLSGGQLQRVHLASVLVHDPDILVLDEPTVGLDPAERIRFRRILKAQSSSRAVLVSTHLMDDVALAAGEVLVMDDGRIRWRGTVDELARLGAGADNDGASPTERGYLQVLSR